MITLRDRQTEIWHSTPWRQSMFEHLVLPAIDQEQSIRQCIGEQFTVPGGAVWSINDQSIHMAYRYILEWMYDDQEIANPVKMTIQRRTYLYYEDGGCDGRYPGQYIRGDPQWHMTIDGYHSPNYPAWDVSAWIVMAILLDIEYEIKDEILNV